MKQYISPDKSKTFKQKSQQVQKLINTTLYILDCFGIPIDTTPRRLERMAISFLATADIKNIADFKSIKDFNSGYSLKTRDVINYVNLYFGENISSGSYDDIRRKDLVQPVEAGIVLKAATKPNADTNDGTRGYALDNSCADVVRSFGSEEWDGRVKAYMEGRESLAVRLKMERNQEKIPVKISDDVMVELDSGPHNKIQKEIIDEFLPRFGHGAVVLYVGDTSEKQLYRDQGKLDEIERKVSDVAKFCCKTVELLYKKGLLDKNDIISLLVGFEYFDDADALEIITD